MAYEPKLPSAVAAQAEKADQIMKDLATGAIVDVVDDPGKKPGEATTPLKKEEVTPLPASNADYEALKHKFEVLQGKYNAETGDLRRQLVQSHETIDRQNTMILDLHNRVKALEGGGDGGGERPSREPDPSKVAQPGGPKKLDPSQFEGYGSEMKELIDGFNTLVEENQRLKGTVTEAKKRDDDSAWTSFTNGLAALVPDWEALNYDKDFIAYLAGFDLETDVMSRQQKLNHFVSSGDFQKAAKIFNAYKTGKGAAAGSGPARPSKDDIIQPDLSAGGGGAPVKTGGVEKDVTAEEVHAATQAYIQKRLSYEELEKIQKAFQNTLARQNQARK